MNFKTFEEWKAAGFHVVKGEKSHHRNESGQALFSSKQVERNRQRRYAYPDKTYGFDWDEEQQRDHDQWDLDYY